MTTPSNVYREAPTMTRPVFTRGDRCDHTEHAQATEYVGRYFDWDIGGAGKWEPCPNEPSYGAVARAEALAAGLMDKNGYIVVASADDVESWLT